MDEFIPVNEPVLDGQREGIPDPLHRNRMDLVGRPGRPGVRGEAWPRGLAGRTASPSAMARPLWTLPSGRLRLPEGSEVIMPAFTIISCAAAIVRAGLVPVLVDAEPLTWNMDVGKIARATDFQDQGDHGGAHLRTANRHAADSRTGSPTPSANRRRCG